MMTKPLTLVPHKAAKRRAKKPPPSIVPMKIVTMKPQGAEFIDFNRCVLLLAKMHLSTGKADIFKHSITDIIEALHCSVLSDFRKISKRVCYISNQDSPQKGPRFFVLSSAVKRLAAENFKKDLDGLAYLDAALAKYSRVIDYQHCTKLLPETPKFKTNMERLHRYIKRRIDNDDELIIDIHDRQQKIAITYNPKNLRLFPGA